MMARRATKTAKATLVAFLMVASGVLGLVGETPSASAHTFTKTDGNDSPGRLDLQSVSVTHGAHGLVYTFTTYERWKANAKLNDSFFMIAVDEQGDGTPNRCAFIYYYGRLRGEITNCGRKIITVVKVSKPSSRQARLVYGVSTKSYQWFGASYWKGFNCGKGCWDYAPNKQWLLHDLEPPTTSWVTTLGSPYSSTALSTTNVVPVTFTASDDDTNVASWTISRVVGATSFEEVDSGTGGGTVMHDLTLEEGQSYAMRVSATDTQGNSGGGLGFLKIAVPYDDANPIVQYSAGWTHTTGDGYFQGTYSSSSTPGATMTITFTSTGLGSTVTRLIGGPANGTADFAGGWILDETPSTPQLSPLQGIVESTTGTYSYTITVLSGTFVVDGILVSVE